MRLGWSSDRVTRPAPGVAGRRSLAGAAGVVVLGAQGPQVGEAMIVTVADVVDLVGGPPAQHAYVAVSGEDLGAQ